MQHKTTRLRHKMTNYSHIDMRDFIFCFQNHQLFSKKYATTPVIKYIFMKYSFDGKNCPE